MINDTIINFLQSKKDVFLQKKVKKDLQGKKGEFDPIVQEKSKGKFFDEAEQKYGLKGWFENIEKIRASVTTHPAKMTNAKIDAGVTRVFFQGKKNLDGYLRTGNVQLLNFFDISRNGATNTVNYDVFEFLNCFVNSENCKIIDLFRNDDQNLVLLIQSHGCEYSDIKSRCIELYDGNDVNEATHTFLKQVYFPVDDNYHLLSLKTSSLILFEIKRRIHDIENIWVDGKHIRELRKIGIETNIGYREIIGSVAIGYGNLDVKEMGNYSYLNVLNSGVSVALPSIPPLFEKRAVRLPTKDFFIQTLYLKAESDRFVALHKYVLKDQNNMQIRQKIQKIIGEIIDQILCKAYQLRQNNNAGWSATEYYKDLPLSQKIWLDDSYDQKRQEDHQWRDDIAKDISRVMVAMYEDINQVKIFGDPELKHIQKLIIEGIETDKEFF